VFSRNWILLGHLAPLLLQSIFVHTVLSDGHCRGDILSALLLHCPSTVGLIHFNSTATTTAGLGYSSECPAHKVREESSLIPSIFHSFSSLLGSFHSFHSSRSLATFPAEVLLVSLRPFHASQLGHCFGLSTPPQASKVCLPSERFVRGRYRVLSGPFMN
jgi:hypothetical protein